MLAVLAKPPAAFVDCQQHLPAMPRRPAVLLSVCCLSTHPLCDCKSGMAVGYILWYRCGCGMSYVFIFVLWTTEISLQHPSRNQCHCAGAIRGSYQKLEQDWERFLVDPLHAAIFSQVWGDSCLCFTLPNNNNKAVNWISACTRPIKSYLEINLEARLNI